MTSAVASPTLLHASNNSNNYPGSPKSGILLNPLPQGRSPLRQSLPLCPSESSASRHSAPNTPFMHIHGATVPLPRTSSHSSSNSGGASPGGTKGGGHHSRANSMRIRFAPLPDPRKMEEQEYLDSPVANNNLALLPTDDASPASPTTPGSQYSHMSANSTGSASLSGGSALFGYSASDDGRDGTETASDQGIFSSPVQKSRSWTKRIFKPLLKSSAMGSSSSATGGTGHQSDDGLWRTNSRDSLQSATSNEGIALSRRMTTDSTSRPSSSGNGAPSNGAPLTRVQSAGIGPGRSRKNTKMLNGRVYGAKSASAAFQNIKDVEPTFVEWGNGGAGSVNNHSGGAVNTKYAGVQSANRVSIGAVSDGDGSQMGGDDYDDGSGVAWLRKRKQMKEERAAKEREEKEKAERAKAAVPAALTISADNAEEKASASIAVPASSNLTTPPERDDAEGQAQTHLQARAPPERKSSQTIETVSPRQGSGTPIILSPSAMGLVGTVVATPSASGTHTPAAGEEHHIVKAVNIPATMPHTHGHGHGHAHHAHGHDGVEELKAVGGASTTAADTSGVALALAAGAGAGAAPSSKSSTDSDSGEEDDDDDEREEDESETDEEDNAENEQRKTSVCAGVEKVSRHKEVETQ